MMKEQYFGKLIHGGDYNPEQWLEQPEILEKDIEYFKKAHINEVSMGIFSWSILEPQEGIYRFEWMQEIIDKLYVNGISVAGTSLRHLTERWTAPIPLIPELLTKLSI